MRKWIGLAQTLAVLAMLAPGTGQAAQSAVVFGYHRFGDSTVLDTPVEQLEEQVSLLKSGGFTVLPLPQVVDALVAGKALPDKAVALTIDAADRSLWQDAWPVFKAAGLPITVFIATDEVDGAGPEGLGWDQLRAMAASGLVTIASQGAARLHMTAQDADTIAADLARAQSRFRQELGTVPDLFAWPYGEMSRTAADQVRQHGYKAAFGLHSGPAWSGADRWFLPRFSLNTTYGEPERFRLAARSLPMPAVDISPDDPVVSTNPPVFGFTLAEDIAGDENLACYVSREGRALVERLGPRVEIRLTKPLPRGRSRLNCTAPSLDGRWRWFGWQFTVN